MAILGVISGGPGVGKTAVIKELRNRGYTIINEAAREVNESDPRFIGKSISEIDKKKFQDEILNLQINRTKELSKIKGFIFSDRGFGDTIAYYKIHNIPFIKPNFVKKYQYGAVFILDILPKYEKDNLRTESRKEQELVHNEITNTYKKMKQKIIHVPVMSIKKLVDFIIKILQLPNNQLE